MTMPRVPSATYRVQLNQRFQFSDARRLVPYLSRLGVSDLYVSPVFRARAGSEHGYDVTDPTSLNPELGGPEAFDALAEELRRHDMGLILDIVPNHMAASPENPWWMDVLENGATSPYASYFDINWRPSAAARGLEPKVLLPILGAPYGETLERGELRLALEERGLFVCYYETALPLDPKTYRPVLEHRLSRLKESLGTNHPAYTELIALLEAIERLPDRAQRDPEAIDERRRDKERIKADLWRYYSSQPEATAFLDENLAIFNGTPGEPRRFDLLDSLLADQAYRLAYWRTAREMINYRRFFDISELVGLRVEDPEVFEATHALVLRLAREGKITGVRCDHVDGLADPLGYLRRLRARLTESLPPGRPAPGFYVVVEKILTGNEELPDEWPVEGTTGYEFLNDVNGLAVDRFALDDLGRLYAERTGIAETVR
ncbi:MAG: malto-oligosyltrehalose synthase, partial [Thermomicrobiaceae bacterium]|nr:malto-oligosyltrehalose synthase [Thermomicrobiaceae bacterium]